MSVVAEPNRLTWEAFIELPGALLKHAELLDGEVHQMAPQSRFHQLTLVRLLRALSDWADRFGGEVVPDTLVRINAQRGYQPDVAWYAPSRVPPTGYWVEPPNLVVEILSPSTRQLDVLRKPGDYFAVGVQEVWLIDIDVRRIVVLRPDVVSDGFGDGDELVTSLLAEFSLDVTSLIAAET